MPGPSKRGCKRTMGSVLITSMLSRIVEVFGPEQSGKTTLALSSAHQVGLNLVVCSCEGLSRNKMACSAYMIVPESAWDVCCCLNLVLSVGHRESISKALICLFLAI